jgi:hypothetical protein
MHDGGEPNWRPCQWRRKCNECAHSRVIATLASVDMVIRMDRVFGTEFPSQKLNCSVRDDFVGIHVGLRATSGLENDQREVVDELSRDHLTQR